MARASSRPDRASAATVEALFRLFIPIALVCFVGAVFTDLAYQRSATIQFSNTSAWLLLFGLLAAGMAIVLFLLSFLGGWIEGGRRVFVLVLLLAGFAVEVVNFMIHNRDGWTTVVPTGLSLSIVGAVVFLAAAWAARAPLSDRRA